MIRCKWGSQVMIQNQCWKLQSVSLMKLCKTTYTRYYIYIQIIEQEKLQGRKKKKITNSIGPGRQYFLTSKNTIYSINNTFCFSSNSQLQLHIIADSSLMKKHLYLALSGNTTTTVLCFFFPFFSLAYLSLSEHWPCSTPWDQRFWQSRCHCWMRRGGSCLPTSWWDRP